MTPHCPLLLALPPLSSAQWRCLRVLSEVADIAHAARKLHWSQAVLMVALAELHERMGAQHIALADARVQFSPALKNLIFQQTPGRQFAAGRLAR
ncbi:hypothetical protein [Polaromonas glacialis]|uniref:hypothetical protein n=1 Tax=Polaromonas glacialis TaxID=866564 RepID=UPI000496F5C5|nr:hypothetical protein [Polaromonas glacialis]